MGIEVLRGRRYCKKVILWQYRGIKTPLTTKSRMGLGKGVRTLLTIKSRIGLGRCIRVPLTIKSKIGLNRNIAWAVIEETSVIIFK